MTKMTPAQLKHLWDYTVEQQVDRTEECYELGLPPMVSNIPHPDDGKLPMDEVLYQYDQYAKLKASGQL